MQKRWDELYGQPNFAPKYPLETVIRWTFKSFPRSNAASTNLLDIGCGMGRHAIFFAREGYRTFATDISPIAIAALNEETSSTGLAIDAKVADCSAAPFDSGSMHGALSYAVLYYCPESSVDPSIREIRRVLAPGGKALLMVKATGDSRCQLGQKLSQFTYRVQPAPDNSWQSENGLDLLFFDRSDLETLFKSFSSMAIDRVTATYNNGALVNDDWIIQVTK